MRALRRLSVVRSGLGLLVLTGSVHPALAATVSWKDPVNGNWTDGTKWSTGMVPAAGDDVIINASGASYTVTLNALVSIVSLTLGATSGAEIQTLSIVGGGTLLPSSTSVVNAKGTLQVSGGTLSGAGAVTVDGTLKWTGGTITGAGALTVNGTLRLGPGVMSGVWWKKRKGVIIRPVS